MKKLLTALVLSLTVFVTGCSVNEPISITDNGSLSGLTSSPKSSTGSENQNADQFSSGDTVSSLTEASAEVSISAPEQSSEETDSAADITQSTDNTTVQFESVPEFTPAISSQSGQSSSSSVLPPQSVPESTTTESISQPEPTEEDDMKTLVVFFSCTIDVLKTEPYCNIQNTLA